MATYIPMYIHGYGGPFTEFLAESQGCPYPIYMSLDSRRVLAFLTVFGCLAMGGNPAGAVPAKHTPEEEIQRLSKLLKPIPDESWKTIAGTRISEKYEIVKGDTLYDISKRLFGDARYWPKIWALNNGAITNPHWIKPGNFVAFLPGTGSSLPAIAINGIAVTAENGAEVGTTSDAAPSARIRSMDWKYLPPQSWENINIELPPDVDPLGFDLHAKNRIIAKTGFDLAAVAATDRIPLLGEITGANSDGQYLTIGDTIYITGEDNLQVGTTYAVTTEPATLQSASSDRSGYAYQILGRIKITGVRDNLFTGVVLTNLDYMPRKTRLITLPGRIKGVKPIPGQSPVEGVLLLDPDISTTRTAQHKLVFVDRGSEDVLDYCERQGIGFIPWFPLAAGDLANPGSVLDAVAKRRGAAPSQIALAWVLQRSPVVLPIPGTSKVEHLEENVAAVDIALSVEEFEALDRAGRARS